MTVRARLTSAQAAGLVALCGIVIGCQVVLGISDYQGAGGDAAGGSATTGSGGATTGSSTLSSSSSTMSSTVTSSTTATGGGGGGGGEPVTLSDNGLVVRYYLDEASSGSVTMPLVDSAAMPLELSPQDEGSMYYDAPGGFSGIRWDLAELDARFLSLDGNNKISTLLNAAQFTATIEIVAAVLQTTDRNSRFIGWSPQGDAGSDFSFGPNRATGAGSTESFFFRSNNETVGVLWNSPVGNQLRVLHVVIDRASSVEADWHVLYIDGMRQADPVHVAKAMGPYNQPLVLDSADQFSLGNRTDGARSIGGFLGYVAIYDIAMDPIIVGAHATLLKNNHDSPPQ